MRYTLIAALAALWIAPAFAASSVGVTITVAPWDAAGIYATSGSGWDAPVPYAGTLNPGTLGVAGTPYENKTDNKVWYETNDGCNVAVVFAWDTNEDPGAGVATDVGLGDYAVEDIDVPAHTDASTALWFKAWLTGNEVVADPDSYSGTITLTLTANP